MSLDSSAALPDATERGDAIRAASGSTIAVMNNIWEQSSENGFYTPSGMGTMGLLFYDIYTDTAIPDKEITAFKEAVANTVLVFKQGDRGFNSINGMIQTRSGFTGDPDDDVAWKTVDAENGVRNIGSSYALLPGEVMDDDGNLVLKGKVLSVIALDEDAEGNEVIHHYSNGCGDAMEWCLGAPGVGIKSATLPATDIASDAAAYETRHGTGVATVHVTGAVAVVASTFPARGLAKPKPEDLVAIILQTADYIPIEGYEDADFNPVYGHGALNLARATSPIGLTVTATASGVSVGADASLDNSGITLPTSFGESLGGFTVGFIDDYNRAYIGKPSRISRENAAFTLGDTIATWESPELQSIALDSNSKMQFTNYDENSDAKDTLIFTHNLPNHVVSFSYKEQSKTPDFKLANTGEELHFQKIRPIASDLMQVNSTHKLGKAWSVKNAITSGEFDTGNRFNEAMANLNYTGENHNLTIGAGTLQEYGQFLGASGTGAYQLSDATQSRVTHLALTQNLPLGSAIKLKYTGFKTEVDMRYSSFANINDLTANEYQLSFGKQQILGKNDSLNLELIQPFAVTDGTLQQNTVLGYNAEGGYNNVTQNYNLAPANRRQQIRMTWQNQINFERKTKLFISMQYENHVNNLRDNEDSSILGGISTRF